MNLRRIKWTFCVRLTINITDVELRGLTGALRHGVEVHVAVVRDEADLERKIRGKLFKAESLLDLPASSCRRAICQARREGTRRRPPGNRSRRPRGTHPNRRHRQQARIKSKTYFTIHAGYQVHMILFFTCGGLSMYSAGAMNSMVEDLHSGLLLGSPYVLDTGS